MRTQTLPRAPKHAAPELPRRTWRERFRRPASVPQPLAAPEPAPAGAGYDTSYDHTGWDVAPVLEAWTDGPQMLDRVLDGLRNPPPAPEPETRADLPVIADEPEQDPDDGLPVTALTVFCDDGSEPVSREILSGWPQCAGTRTTASGQRAGGVWIGREDDAHLVLESPSPAYLRELAACAAEAAARLECEQGDAPEPGAVRELAGDEAAGHPAHVGAAVTS
jgi:hypothetical protein